MCIFQLPPPFHLLFGFRLILNTLPQVASCMSEFESLGKLNCESGCEFVYEVEYVAPIVTYCRFCQLFTSSMNCLLRLFHKQAGHARPTFKINEPLKSCETLRNSTKNLHCDQDVQKTMLNQLLFCHCTSQKECWLGDVHYPFCIPSLLFVCLTYHRLHVFDFEC